MINFLKIFNQNKSVVGVDVDIDSVNVVQVQSQQANRKTFRVVIEKIENTKEDLREIAIKAAIKKALSKFDTSHASIIYSICDQKTIVDHIPMPIMPAEELSQAVKLQISNAQHYPLENPLYDYQTIGRNVEKGIEKFNVMLAVISKATLDVYINRFKSSAINSKTDFKKLLLLEDLTDVNISKAVPLAISFEQIIKDSHITETVSVLYIGSTTSEIDVFKDGQLEFSRKISVLAGDLTKSLTSAIFTDSGKIELTLSEAANLKKEFGIPAPGENFLIRGKITANQALSLLRPKLEQLSREINRCFDFYYDRNQVKKIEKIILYGDAALLKGFKEFLNAELGLTVIIGNPIENADLILDDQSQVTPEKAQALVAAIGASLVKSSQGINLLPASFRNLQTELIIRTLIAASVGIMIAIGAVIYTGLFIEQNLTKKQLEIVKKQYQALLPKVEHLKRKLTVSQHLDTRMEVDKLLLQLSFLPKKAFLTQLKIENDALEITGLIMANNQESNDILNPLVKDLGKISIYEAKLVSVKDSPTNNAMSEFVIQGNLNKGEEK